VVVCRLYPVVCEFDILFAVVVMDVWNADKPLAAMLSPINVEGMLSSSLYR
jgi:hypothetical protein